MKLATRLLAMAVAVLLFGCTSMDTADDELLSKPSLHILVNDEAEVPEGATFDFDTRLFKMDYSEEMDLAAIDARLATNLEAALREKGYVRTTGASDLLVSYAAAVDSAISAEEFNAAYADEFPVSFPDLGSDLDTHFLQGVLIVDFVDRSSRTLLWRGAIQAGLEEEVSDEVKERRIGRAVRVLLAHFPRPVQEASP